MANDGDYEVGYGKPPKASQFKPGQSGNPKGRPKAAPKLEELFAKEAAKLVKVTVDGEKQSLTQAHVVVKAMFQKAMKGDQNAARLVIAGLAALPDAPVDQVAISDHDMAQLRDLLGLDGDS